MVGGFTWKDIHTLTVENFGLKSTIQNTVETGSDRLAAYEETGLEPEDMKKAFNEDATLKLAGQILRRVIAPAASASWRRRTKRMKSGSTDFITAKAKMNI